MVAHRFFLKAKGLAVCLALPIGLGKDDRFYPPKTKDPLICLPNITTTAQTAGPLALRPVPDCNFPSPLGWAR